MAAATEVGLGVVAFPVMPFWLQKTHWCGQPAWGMKKGMIMERVGGRWEMVGRVQQQ
jgi:hypothetical protein